MVDFRTLNLHSRRPVRGCTAIKNTEKSLWVFSLLEPHTADRALEIGFGSGADIRRVAARIPEGFVMGIDHLEAMVRLATAKSAREIVTLRQASASKLTIAGVPFLDLSSRSSSTNRSRTA
jgi:ubiquinone/menaquinone biosynthesis C-methylase UbiE